MLKKIKNWFAVNEDKIAIEAIGAFGGWFLGFILTLGFVVAFNGDIGMASMLGLAASQIINWFFRKSTWENIHYYD